MIGMIKAAVLMVAFATGAPTASSMAIGPVGQLTAENLRQNCTDPTHSEPDPSPVYFFCYGFLIGANEGLSEAGGRTYCLEPGVDILQMRKVIVKFLDDHPEKLHKSAISAYSEAMRAAFPCTK